MAAEAHWNGDPLRSYSVSDHITWDSRSCAEANQIYLGITYHKFDEKRPILQTKYLRFVLYKVNTEIGWTYRWYDLSIKIYLKS